MIQPEFSACLFDNEIYQFMFYFRLILRKTKLYQFTCIHEHKSENYLKPSPYLKTAY